MNFSVDNDLKLFVQRFFELNDGLMEKSSGGLELLLPKQLALRLNTPEYLQMGADGKAEEKFAIQYGSPLVEKIVEAVCDTAPLVSCRLDFNYIKRQGFDRLIQDSFVFTNAVGRVKSAAEVRTVYLLLACRYLAQSDEQKEGLFELTFNLESGAAVVGMSDMLDAVEKTFETDKKRVFLEDDKIKDILAWLQRAAGGVLRKEIEPFQDSMNRRFRRDVANLEEYYQDLKEEMLASLKRPGISDQLKSDREEKIALLPEELERKKADLYKKYSIRAGLELCGAIQIRTPAVKLLFQASIGRKQKQLSMMYNPVSKSMDPLVCDGCGASTFHIRFCTNLHLLCPACATNCPVC